MSIQPILRDARIHDIKGIVQLADKLIIYESKLANWELIEDKEERHQLWFSRIGQALCNPDYKIMVIEKSGRIIGFFILNVVYQFEIFKEAKYCNIWLTYSTKGAGLFKEVYRESMKWAKEKGCSFARATITTNNKRVHRLMKALRFKEQFTLYDKEVTL